MNPLLLNRREAIIRFAQLTGLVLVGAPALLRGTTTGLPPGTNGNFSAADLALLDEIGETIIPATTTPGAKAVGIGAFMAMMVGDCYYPEQQAAFQAGLRELEGAAQQRFGRGFCEATAAQRTALLNEIQAEARLQGAGKGPAAPVHYFTMLKQLTIVGYFTSETGGRAAFNYEEVPGRYEGDAPYRPGDKTDYAMPSGNLKGVR